VSRHFEFLLCAVCATPRESGTNCPTCRSDRALRARDGFILELPADMLPCPGCGSATEPLHFRGWVRLMSLVWWVREARAGGYVCADCARKETAKSLLITALLGWLSVPSWFFYGWRATYFNWRSVWTAPAKPYDWGAMSANEFIHAAQAGQEDLHDDIEEPALEDSPLRFLDATQQRLVLGADGLYALLGVAPNASVSEIKRAYYQCSREAHPDLHAGASTEEMVRLNQAWEILRNERMRTAYDWLCDYDRATT